MNFERHQPPLRTLGIGRARQRVFKDVEEAAQWAYLFPGEYTRWIVDDWFGKNPQNGLPFFSIRSQEFDGNALFIRGNHKGGKFVRDPDGVLTIQTGKLQMVKWFKANVHFSEYPEAIIGLRECKKITDRVERIIWKKLKNL